MYRVFLLIAFFTYGSTAPYSAVNVQNSFSGQQEQLLGQQQVFGQQQRPLGQQQLSNTAFQQNDDSDTVDNAGSGYAFFKKQQIESRPFIQAPILNQDLSAYTKASAFTQQPFQTQILGANKDLSTVGGYGQQQQQDLQPIVPQQQQYSGYGQSQQKVLPQQDFSGYGQTQQKVLPQQELSGYGQSQQKVLPQQDFSGYGQSQQKVLPQQQQYSGYGQTQQKVLPQQDFSGYGQVQRKVLPQQELSGYGQIQQQDLQSNIPPQQILLPQTNLNWQQKTLDGYGSQVQDVSFLQKPRQIMSTEQKSFNFGSSYGGQGQQQIPSGFGTQSNQQNDMDLTSTSLFMPSEGLGQRVISQPQQRFGSGGYQQ